MSLQWSESAEKTLTRGAEPGKFWMVWHLLQRKHDGVRAPTLSKCPVCSGSDSSGSGFESSSLDSGKFRTAPALVPNPEKCLALASGKIFWLRRLQLLLWFRISGLNLSKLASNGHHCQGEAWSLSCTWWSVTAMARLTWLLERIGDKPLEV